MPVYLITVFSKGEKASLTGKESSALKAITKSIVAEHQKRWPRQRTERVQQDEQEGI
jgi:hypothetical protein